MGWNSKPKTARQLSAVGRQRVDAARRHIGEAWKEFQGMKTVMTRLKRTRPLKPLSAN